MQTTKIMRFQRPRRWWIEFTVGAMLFVAITISAGVISERRPQAEARPGSDFWDLLTVDGAQYKWFSSLDEMTGFASVVVQGHITSVSQGRAIIPDAAHADRSAAYYLNATVSIDRVLHGAVADPSSSVLTIELFTPDRSRIPAIIAETPSDEEIFFLINKAVHPATAGLDPLARAAEAKYYEILGEQGRLAIVSGLVKVAGSVDSSQFPSELDGRSLESVASMIGSVR
jgi:hypothetical protein